jgi:hypothetical protein
MYNALESERARREIILESAKVVLPRPDLYRLHATSIAVEPAFRVRNQFAHHLWGDSPDIPDALLLAQPETIIHDSVMYGLESVLRKQRGEPYEEVADKGANHDPTRIKVWRRRDLEAAVDDMTKAVGAIGRMSEICLPGQFETVRERARAMLEKWDRYPAAFKRAERRLGPLSPPEDAAPVDRAKAAVVAELHRQARQSGSPTEDDGPTCRWTAASKSNRWLEQSSTP